MKHPILFSAENNMFLLMLTIALVIGVIFATRAIFSIPRIIRTLRAQAYLLGEIAEKQGVAQSDIINAIQHIDHESVKLELKKRS